MCTIPTMASWKIEVLPPTFQSGSITFLQWISLITLGLASLIAHVISGASEPIYLSPTRPRWHDRMCLYCPLTILWRYMAIADRRIRAQAWSSFDMMGANAIFWTDNGWDGSEETAEDSASYCERRPPRAHLTFFSWDSVKTIVTTLQGVQTLVASQLTVFKYSGHLQVMTSVPSVLGPFAIMGLLRLCAAVWITSDFSYASVPESTDQESAFVRKRAPSVDSLLLPQTSWSQSLVVNPSACTSSARFRSTSLASVMFRIVYIAFFSGICIIGVPLWSAPLQGRVPSSISTTLALCSLLDGLLWAGSTASVRVLWGALRLSVDIDSLCKFPVVQSVLWAVLCVFNCAVFSIRHRD